MQGFEVEDWYGIRVVSDHLIGVGADQLDAVLPVEVAASRRDPYRALGRLIHVVARLRPRTPGQRRGVSE
jgi:hypothetical protein